MTSKVNILIDGGFFLCKFKEKHGKSPNASDVVKEVNNIMTEMKAKGDDDTKDILFRVYYYDCKPFDETIKSADGKKEIDFSKSTLYYSKQKFLNDLCKKEQFAVRLGELSFDGWKQDKHSKKWIPDFKQKSVDMKVGLDMALMGLKHTCDKIVLVAGDSDFIAPMKFVRKEGMLVYLYKMGHYVKSKLIEHSDFVLS